jgi:hypothetical protein
MGRMSDNRTTWEYDADGNPIRELEENGTSDLRPDASGNLELANERSSRREVRCEYKYDSYGNWMERNCPDPV